MYQWHNYGKTTIGARTDVENVDIPRLQAFYRTYYQPDNATLIVSGKFDPAKVLGWIAADLRPHPQADAQRCRALYTLDPVQDGERSVTLRRVGGVPQVHAAATTCRRARTPTIAAIELLDLIIGDTPVGPRCTSGWSSGSSPPASMPYALATGRPGVALFGAQLAPGQDVRRGAQRAAGHGRSRVASEPVTDEEFKRAQAKWLKDWDQPFTNPETVGVSLSRIGGAGRLAPVLPDCATACETSTLRRRAARGARSTCCLATARSAIYVPTDKPLRAPAPGAWTWRAQLKSFKPQAAAAAVEAFDATPANIDAAPQRFGTGRRPEGGAAAQGARAADRARLDDLRFGDETQPVRAGRGVGVRRRRCSTRARRR